MSKEELIRRAEDIRYAVNYLIRASNNDGFIMIGFFLKLAELAIDSELAERGVPRDDHPGENGTEKRH
jgi:hypothetical protein